MGLFVQIHSVLVIENELMIASCLTNEKKTHKKSREIYTDEKDLLNNNVLFHEECTKPSPITKVK